ncbi:MAG: hydratase [Psychromonas sp.]|nr:hydratase [Alteromonadales bacterium]MCP5076762.1 hydratase [Psychromonas sp.]
MNNYQQAAKALLNNRRENANNDRLMLQLRPENCEQALQIQAEMVNLRSDEVAAWKCLLPLNEDQLVVAPIFSNTVQSGKQCKMFADKDRARIEPEIAFVLAVDLPARQSGYSENEIDNAVQGCFMALELMQDRFSEDETPSFHEKLADCLVNQGLFIGPEIDKQQAYLASEIKIEISQSNNKQTYNGKHPNQLPQKPLYWLINFMSKRGIDFKAGQAIITGSYAGVIDVNFDTATTILYSGLGEYQVMFNELF